MCGYEEQEIGGSEWVGFAHGHLNRGFVARNEGLRMEDLGHPSIQAPKPLLGDNGPERARSFYL